MQNVPACRALWALVLWGYVAVAAAAQAPVRLLVIGDSLSAAYGMEVDEGWVALLTERLAARLPEAEVVNASLSGETSAGLRSRLPGLIEQHRPTHAIVEIGGNDGLRALPTQALEANLSAIITALKSSGARVLLVGMRIPPNYGPRYTAEFHALYSRVAAAQEVPLVPFLLEGVGGHAELMQADGIHAAPKAQGRLMENVWPGLAPLLGLDE